MEIILLGLGLTFCGYLLGYNRAAKNTTAALSMFANLLVEEGLVDKNKLNEFYARRTGHA
jgi:mannitol/fructose-specific phosphotransferase system IIA component